jgi:hypothetical protein
MNPPFPSRVPTRDQVRIQEQSTVQGEAGLPVNLGSA